MYEDDYDDGYIYDDYAVCTDMENVENVNPSKRDAPGYRTFRAPVISPEMQGMWDRSRIFQPIAPVILQGYVIHPGHRNQLTQNQKGLLELPVVSPQE